MLLWFLFGSFYLLVALFAIFMTYDEQKNRRQGTQLLNGVSYLLCLVWPLLILGVFIAVRTQSQGAQTLGQDESDAVSKA